MSVFRRISTGIEKVWSTYPAIGIVALFVVLGYGVYQSTQAKDYALQARTAVRGQLAAKDDTITEKDREITDLHNQLAAKDASLTGLTIVVGQIYNAAIALQGQVTALGGQPKTIPVTLPRPTTLTPPAVSSTVLPGAAFGPKAPVTVPQPNLPPPRTAPPAVNLQVQCLVICPQKGG